MNRSPAQLLPFVVVGLVLIALASNRGGGTEEHRELLTRLFHLPADVELVVFRSGYAKSNEYIQAVAQLTPAQYYRYTNSFDDPSVWRLEPFRIDGLVVTGTPEPSALAWWDGDLATISMERGKAMFWVDWHGMELDDGKPDVWHIANSRTLCFGWDGPDENLRIAACNQFEPHDSPRGYVRAKLDDDDHRVFMFIP